MTNRERLAQMTDEQLAAELCANHFYFDCSACPAEEMCDYDDNMVPVGDGLIKWLNKKVVEHCPRCGFPIQYGNTMMGDNFCPNCGARMDEE